MQSLRPLKDPRMLLIQVALSVVIWVIPVATEYLMLMVFDLHHLGWSAALTVLAAIMVGMLLPAPPGFAGNFEAFTMAGLAVFGVGAGIGLGYALLLHWIQFAQVCVMGMYYLYKDDISFRSVWKFSRQLKPDARQAE